MTWAELWIVFVVCHLAGDYVLQTERQANNKHAGLGRDPVARRALFSHVGVYTLTMIPALIWIGAERGLVAALVVGAVVALPHLVIDDGRLLDTYMRKVKGTNPAPSALTAAVDQSLHLILLFAAAVLAAAWG